MFTQVVNDDMNNIVDFVVGENYSIVHMNNIYVKDGHRAGGSSFHNYLFTSYAQDKKTL